MLINDRYQRGRQLNRPKAGLIYIYQAQDLESDNDTVALKLLSQAGVDDPSTWARFQQEARIISQLEHDYVVHLYEANETHQPPYLALRLYSGGSLAQRLQAGKLTPDIALTLIDKIGQAVDYIHRQGVVHQRISPENILFDQHGEPALIDFNQAQVLQKNRLGLQETTLTDAAKLNPTSPYLSPELVSGKSNATIQSDLYALAVVFYQMIRGTLPSYQPASKSGGELFETDIPPDWNGIVDRALAINPADRYNTAAEMVRALRDVYQIWIGSQAISAVDPIAPAKPQRLRMWIGSVIGLLLLAAGSGWFMQTQINAAQPLPTRVAVVVEVSPTATTTATVTHTPSATSTREPPTSTPTVVVLPTETPLPTAVSLPTAVPLPERLTANNIDRLTSVRTITYRGAISNVSLNPEETILAVGSQDGSLRLYDSATLSVIAESSLLGTNKSVLSWSPDGNWVVVSSENNSLLLAPKDNLDARDTLGEALVFSWSPDGTYLVSGLSNGVQVWTVSDETEHWVKVASWAESTASVTAVSWSDDGQQIAVGTENGQLVILSFAASTPQMYRLATLEGHVSPLEKLVWADEGQILLSLSSGNILHGYAVATAVRWLRRINVSDVLWLPTINQFVVAEQGQLHFYDIAEGNWQPATRLTNTGLNTNISLEWSQTGLLIARDARQWQLWNVDTSERVAVSRFHTSDIAQFISSPDDQQILTTDASGSYFWTDTTDPSNSEQALYGHAWPIAQAFWLDNGQRLITFGDIDQIVRLWDVATGKQIAIIGEHITKSTATIMRLKQVVWSSNMAVPRIATLGTDDVIRVWDLEQDKVVQAFYGHQVNGPYRNDEILRYYPVSHIAWSPHDDLIASIGHDGIAFVWRVSTGEVEARFEHNEALDLVFWSPDGRYLIIVTGRADGQNPYIYVWDVATKTLDQRFSHQMSAPQDISWPPDTNRTDVVLAGQSAVAVQVYDLGVPFNKFLRGFTEHQQGASAVDWSPDGTVIATGGYGTGELKLYSATQWDPSKVQLLNERDNAHRGRITQLLWLADGQTFLTAGVDGNIRFWDRGTLTAIVVESGVATRSAPFLDRFDYVAMDSERRRLAIINNASQVLIWEVASQG